MDAAASLRQTVTHLFDAVKYSSHAKELEEAAKEAESSLEVELAKLESQTDEVRNLLSRMEGESSQEIRDLSVKLEDFLNTAASQAKAKMERQAKDGLEERRRLAEVERDKALKSLEAYLASDPLPVIESMVHVKLNDGIYEALARYECDGGMKYDFRLASQNSGLFHRELALSRLGYELKVPVRFSRAILKKERVPGFERLDQYVLSNAETSGGKIRANFQKLGNGASMKVVTSGSGESDFVGLEYSDEAEAVNVMNDPALSALVDLGDLRKAAAEIVTGMGELAKKKVALLRLTLNGEEPLDSLDYERILDLVLKVLGAPYRSVVTTLSKGAQAKDALDGLTVEFIQDRVRVLGKKAAAVSQALGVPQSK